MIQDILRSLNLSDTQISVYLKLLDNSAVSARHIANQLELPRATVYDALRHLEQTGLIIGQNNQGVKVFVAEDPHIIGQLLQQKISEFEQSSKKLAETLPKLHAGLGRFGQPKVKIFAGAKETRRMFDQVFWEENLCVKSVFRLDELLELFGQDYLMNFERRRAQKNISMRWVLPQSSASYEVLKEILARGLNFKREIKFAPKEFFWKTGYTIYSDKVHIFSSLKEGTAVQMQSPSIAEFMSTQFDMLWSFLPEFKSHLSARQPKKAAK
jgi:sugar-specific transcriptional regulator TrmB